MFANKTIMITGGTGSFGKTMLNELLISHKPKEIIIFSRDEKKQDELRKTINNSTVKFHIGDIRDYETISNVINEVNYIFHAAALKQVPSCEFFPLEAVKTNIIGTDNILRAAGKNAVQKVVVLSTDKSVYPINAMGMSKALMEKVMVARARANNGEKQIFCGTRYGNVMGSRGSVIPMFINQIRNGKPLSVTDPNMTRFMMTLDEALKLVLFAFKSARSGDIFIQKSPAVTIEILANAFLEIYNASNEINIIGTRHGEKLYETLVNREEMNVAEDLGQYYRIPADIRDLNYDQYFFEGEQKISFVEEYNSHNTKRLSLDQTKELLLKLPMVQDDLFPDKKVK